MDMPKQSEKIQQGLTFVKKKSDSVTTAQEAGIDLAMTTAYTFNKNVIDFTHVAQGLVSTNLGQQWEIFTKYEKIDQIGFKYTPYYS